MQTYKYRLDLADKPFGCDEAGWVAIINEMASQGKLMEIVSRQSHGSRGAVAARIANANVDEKGVIATITLTPFGLKNINNKKCWGGSSPQKITNEN